MNTISSNKKILYSLTKHRELDLYFFHKSYAMGPGEIIESIHELSGKGLVTFDNNLVKITSKGRKELLINKDQYFYTKEKEWLTIPPEMRIRGIRITDPYKPEHFDKHFLKKLESE